ncbi:MAG: hypothetical protein KDI37_06050 [Xanthomonadales bacterium]|nr:hypothetical protein [Xanthomonadales bacterium]
MTTHISVVPGARRAHSAVWTGSEMIVWGGDDGNVRTDTGGRYAPTTDRWGAPTSTTESPKRTLVPQRGVERQRNDRLGRLGLRHRPGTGGRYNPVSDTWGAATALGGTAPSARCRHSAVWSGSEMIIWGGFDGNSALYFPYDTASLTTLISLAPSPSLVNEAVTATVQVASPDRAADRFPGHMPPNASSSIRQSSVRVPSSHG